MMGLIMKFGVIIYNYVGIGVAFFYIFNSNICCRSFINAINYLPIQWTTKLKQKASSAAINWSASNPVPEGSGNETNTSPCNPATNPNSSSLSHTHTWMASYIWGMPSRWVNVISMPGIRDCVGIMCCFLLGSIVRACQFRLLRRNWDSSWRNMGLLHNFLKDKKDNIIFSNKWVLNSSRFLNLPIQFIGSDFSHPSAKTI